MAVSPAVPELYSFYSLAHLSKSQFWGARDSFAFPPNRAEGHGNWASSATVLIKTVGGGESTPPPPAMLLLLKVASLVRHWLLGNDVKAMPMLRASHAGPVIFMDFERLQAKVLE